MIKTKVGDELIELLNTAKRSIVKSYTNKVDFLYNELNKYKDDKEIYDLYKLCIDELIVTLDKNLYEEINKIIQIQNDFLNRE